MAPARHIRDDESFSSVGCDGNGGSVPGHGVVAGSQEHDVVVADVFAKVLDQFLAFGDLLEALVGIPTAGVHDPAAHVIALRNIQGDAAVLQVVGISVICVVPVVPGADEQQRGGVQREQAGDLVIVVVQSRLHASEA